FATSPSTEWLRRRTGHHLARAGPTFPSEVITSGLSLGALFRRRHEHSGGRRGQTSTHEGGCCGSAKWNAVPVPTSLSTHTRPPWASMMLLEICSPSPRPRRSLLIWRKRSKPLLSSAEGIPIPVSLTLKRISLASARTRIDSRPLAGGNLIAWL